MIPKGSHVYKKDCCASSPTLKGSHIRSCDLGSIEEKRLGIRVMPWLIVKIDLGGFGVVLFDPFRVVVCTGGCLV